MARVRMINPDFFLHEGLAACSPHARLLFISLWTQADRLGRLRWLPVRILGEAFPHEPNLLIEALAAELVEAGVLVVYRLHGDARTYAYLPGFPRWQRPHKNEAASRCPEPPAIGTPLDGQRLTLGAPDTDNGERRTGVRNTDIDSLSESHVGEGVEDSSPASLSEQDLIGSDEVLDFMIETWPRKLGKAETLPRWLKTARDAFPAVDLLAEAKRAAVWEQGQPARKKKQIRAFLTRWWGRAQDRGGSGSSPSQSVEAEALAVARSLGASL